MITKEQATAIIDEYCRAENEKDKQAWLALFAPDVVHEDPVGVRTNTGLEMLSSFWEGFQSANLALRRTAPVILCGNEAIVMMSCEAGPAGGRITIEPIIDNFVFNDAGKIARVRAFYNH